MPDHWSIVPAYRGETTTLPSDALIAELATHQHGVVTRAQLREIGLSDSGIDRRLAWGRLHPLHRGVYAVGHPLPSRLGRWMAAVLAGGEGAVLSHRDAAALWGLRQNSRPRIEITTHAKRERDGIQFHRAVLKDDEVTVKDGIPVTTVARTIFDLASVTNDRQVERAVNEAELLRLWDGVGLSELVERFPRTRGASRARRALERRRETGTTMTRSDLEERFLALVRDLSLPSPEVNAPLRVSGHDYEIDFLWRAQRLAVELDGRETHGTARAFEEDRERDRILTAAGWRPVRFTWRQMHRVGGELPVLLGTV
jgi:very-short-patch-repair endonuclease/predicted transcriptional regulator of viral defense system